MVVIFGWGGGNTKDLGEVAPTTCPRCRNQVFLHHISSDKQFSLYFVPISSYGATEYLLCPICRNGLQLQPAQRGAVNGMAAATRAFRRGALAADAYQAKAAQFWAQLGVDGGGRQVLQASPTIPPPATAGPDARPGPASGGASLAEQLGQLAKLRDDGVVTDEEFTAAKRRLIEG